MSVLNPTYQIKALYGSALYPEKAIFDSGSIYTTFQAGSDYLVIDLGKETQIKNIAFTVNDADGDRGSLRISYKSFSSDAGMSEKIVREIDLYSEISSSANSFQVPCSFFSRIIIFKYNGYGTFTIKSLKVDIGINDSPYKTTDPIALNYKYLVHDENIKNAPKSRVGIMRNGNNVAGIFLGGNSAATIPVTQVSFNAITSKSTLFKLQKRTSNVIFDTDNANRVGYTTGWTDIKTFRVIDYDRLPVTEVDDNGIDVNGTIVTNTTLPSSKFSNNNLVGYVFRPDIKSENLLTILESWTDGTNNYFKVNADLNELGIVPRTKYYIERPNVVTFPFTSATMLQLVQISGGETKINALKSYVNLIDNGVAISPTTGADQLEWSLQVEST